MERGGGGGGGGGGRCEDMKIGRVAKFCNRCENICESCENFATLAKMLVRVANTSQTLRKCC